MLLSFMNELNKSTGTAIVSKNIRYIPQVPWVINDTIRNNITLFKEYSETNLLKAINLCELSKDIEFLKDGINTLIGSRGINLSGGQKQRVSLARSLYDEGDIYLIDDCFSSLDAQMSNQIFNHVLVEHLKSKTRILVTNTSHFLKEVDKSIFIISIRNQRRTNCRNRKLRLFDFSKWST